VSRRILLAAATLLVGGAGLTVAGTPAAHAAGASSSGGEGPLLRVTARCDGPGSKMMLGIHPSATGGVVAATRITHVRHPHWFGATVIGHDFTMPGVHEAQQRIITDWTRSAKPWPKPVTASYMSADMTRICMQAAESTPRVDTGIAMNMSELIGMRVLARAGVVEVAADAPAGHRVRVAVNIRTAAGYQHRVRFVRADRYGLVDVRFHTFTKVKGYTRALARVMSGHGPSKIIQLARVR